jgi:rhodanese-related sulfurtransferase
MKEMNLQELSERLKKGLSSDQMLIDVREPAEYKTKRIKGAVNIPLKELGKFIDEIKGFKEIFVHCASGKRAKIACEELEKKGVVGLAHVSGNPSDWEKSGLPVICAKFSLQQQVYMTVGTLLFLGSLLALVASPQFAWVPLFIGAMMGINGWLGTCLMEKIIAKMPWNQSSSSCCATK